MHDQHGIRRYREADFGSMGKEKLIALLYEKMVDCYRQAEQAIAAGDRVTMTDRVSHVQRIITELSSALDVTGGGDIALNLAALYDYVFLENLAVLADSDPRHLQNCQRVLCPLLEAWRQVPTGTAARAVRDQATDASGPGEPTPQAVDTTEGEESPPIPAIHE